MHLLFKEVNVSGKFSLTSRSLSSGREDITFLFLVMSIMLFQGDLLRSCETLIFFYTFFKYQSQKLNSSERSVRFCTYKTKKSRKSSFLT